MKTRALTSLLLVLAGCGGGGATPIDAAITPDAPASDALGTDAPAPVPDGGGTGEWTETPYLGAEPIRSFAAAEDVLEDGVDYAARMETDTGTITLDLAEDEAPITVNSFVFLARNHFFEGILFHRVIEGFMAQGGDPNTVSGAPSSWGRGGPGYEFVNESSALRFDARGVLAMANAGPDTNGSQFFITFLATPHLDGGYTIFGHVIEGDVVLSAIARGEPPVNPTRITSVQILQR